MSWLKRARSRDRRGPDGSALRDLIDRLPEGLRQTALTHSSWVEHRSESYERLALLGDAVLGLSVADQLYRTLPGEDAGALTKILNQAVSGNSCRRVGESLGLPELLEAAEPDGRDGRTSARLLLDGSRPLPEITEAMIGACYLEFGPVTTVEAVIEAFSGEIDAARQQRADFKSALQELAARRGLEVAYRVDDTAGPAHDRTYTVTAMVGGKPAGSGEGRSKKAAGQAAAAAALDRLETAP